MKKILSIVIMAWMCLMANAQVAQILGDWKTIDDKTGEALSVVHIYKATDGKYYGKIIDLLVAGHENDVCTECEGANHNKPIKGMIILTGFDEKDGALVNGKVLDPDNGKVYYCKITLKDGKLVLRGSLDKKGLLGRNQTWLRVK